MFRGTSTLKTDFALSPANLILVALQTDNILCCFLCVNFPMSQTSFKNDFSELREELRLEILELVKANRLNILKRGKVFPKYTKGPRSTRDKGAKLIYMFN